MRQVESTGRAYKKSYDDLAYKEVTAHGRTKSTLKQLKTVKSRRLHKTQIMVLWRLLPAAVNSISFHLRIACENLIALIAEIKSLVVI